jgi:hypothetical protein
MAMVKLVVSVPQELAHEIHMMRLDGYSMSGFIRTCITRELKRMTERRIIKSHQNRFTKQNDSPDKELGKSKSKSKNAVVKPEDVDTHLWNDFLTLREKKKAPLTQTALDGICVEAKKAGYTLSEALKECCVRGWQGFNHTWGRNTQQQKNIADKEPPKRGSGLRNFTKERLGTHENAEKSVEELIGGIGKGMP